MNSSSSVRLIFTLSETERGPYPVTTESIWCQPEGEHYRIENIPFFLENLAFGDLIAIGPGEEPDTYRVVQVIEQSGHSTLWIMLCDETLGGEILDELVALGCGREGGVLPNLFALNVPPEVELQKVLNRLDVAAAAGLLNADYPAIRQ